MTSPSVPAPGAGAVPRPIPASLGILFLLLIAAVMGANHVSARIAFEHGTNVITALAVRSVVTALVMLALLRVAGVGLALPAGTRRRGALIGLILTVQSYCLYSAVARIPVALALLAFNTYPMILALLHWVTGHGLPARRVRIALPMALCGLALALDAFGWSGAAGAQARIAGRWLEIGAGVLYASGAALSFAVVLLLTSRWLPRVDGRLRTLMTMSVMAAVAMAVGAVRHAFAWPVDGPGWLGLVLLTLFYGSGISALFVLLPRIGLANNMAVLNFEPVAALLLAWALLGQRMAPVQLLGMAVVIAAILILSIGARR